MRIVLSLLLVLVALDSLCAAGSRSTLVPTYRPCETSVCPPVRTSRFTFESAVLISAGSRYTGPGKLAFTIVLKGVRDKAGTLVTTDPNDPADDFRVRIPESRVTLLQGSLVGTLAPGLSGPTVYRFDVRNGAARKRFLTPDETPERGFVAESTGVPVVVDPDGNDFAVVGVQARP